MHFEADTKPRSPKPGFRYALRCPAALLGLVLGLACLDARAEPPIRSPQDALCRDVAKSRVFTAPDPLNVGLHEIGRRIYTGCMHQASRRAAKPRYARHRKMHRHRRR